MTYPSEFKNKVLETKEKENLSIDQTAERFSIDRSTVIYWVNSNRPHKYPQQKTDDVISDVKKSLLARARALCSMSTFTFAGSAPSP